MVEFRNDCVTQPVWRRRAVKTLARSLRKHVLGETPP